MKFLVVVAITSCMYATTILAQDHIRCQNTIGGPCGDSSRPREMNCCDYGYCQPWNSKYYQCLDKPALCPTQETDIDYKGDDIKTVYSLSPSKCCDECYNTNGCVAYTFVNENPDGKTACYLKKSANGRVEKKGAVSGKLAEPPAPDNCPTIERGIDYSGNDLKSVRFINMTACCDECAKTSSCAGFTFKAVDWDGQSSCYLKTATSGRVANAGTVSGTVKVVQPPANCPVQEADVDYYGNDIKNIHGITGSQCCDECSKTTGCVGYTYVEKSDDGKPACYLKSSTAGKVAKKGAVSAAIKCLTGISGQCGSAAEGAKCCPEGSFCEPWNPWYYQCIAKPPVAKCPTILTGVDFYGGDLEVKFDLLPEGCCDACFQNTNCKVFTFVNYNADGHSACYLKKAIGEQRVLSGAISGYKIQA